MKPRVRAFRKSFPTGWLPLAGEKVYVRDRAPWGRIKATALVLFVRGEFALLRLEIGHRGKSRHYVVNEAWALDDLRPFGRHGAGSMKSSGPAGVERARKNRVPSLRGQA